MRKFFKNLKKDQKGFTLVELMIVVIIIGILVAIAVPVYNSTQQKAKETACKANKRVIQSAILQAQFENKTISEGTLGTDTIGIEEYLEEIPNCPSDKNSKYYIENEGNNDNPKYVVKCEKHDGSSTSSGS